jgi:hypothetical protein
LDAGTDAALTLVAAPAGFGKSTTAAEQGSAAVRHVLAEAAWITVVCPARCAHSTSASVPRATCGILRDASHRAAKRAIS